MKVLDVGSSENIFSSLDERNHKKPRSFAKQIKLLGPCFRPSADFFEFDYFDKPGTLNGYDGYENDGRWGPVAEKIMGQYNPQSVLDFGCAKGFLVYDLYKGGLWHSFGVDISGYALRNAPNEIKSHLVKFNGNNLPFKDKSIDLCVSRGVLEHIPKEDLDFVILEIIRVSKNQFFDITGGNTPITRRYARNWDVTHVTIKSGFWWLKKLKKLGYGGAFVLNEPQVIIDK